MRSRDTEKNRQKKSILATEGHGISLNKTEAETRKKQTAEKTEAKTRKKEAAEKAFSQGRTRNFTEKGRSRDTEKSNKRHKIRHGKDRQKKSIFATEGHGISRKKTEAETRKR